MNTENFSIKNILLLATIVFSAAVLTLNEKNVLNFIQDNSSIACNEKQTHISQREISPFNCLQDLKLPNETRDSNENESSTEESEEELVENGYLVALSTHIKYQNDLISPELKLNYNTPFLLQSFRPPITL